MTTYLNGPDLKQELQDVKDAKTSNFFLSWYNKYV